MHILDPNAAITFFANGQAPVNAISRHSADFAVRHVQNYVVDSGSQAVVIFYAKAMFVLEDWQKSVPLIV